MMSTFSPRPKFSGFLIGSAPNLKNVEIEPRCTPNSKIEKFRLSRKNGHHGWCPLFRLSPHSRIFGSGVHPTSKWVRLKMRHSQSEDSPFSVGAASPKTRRPHTMKISNLRCNTTTGQLTYSFNDRLGYRKWARSTCSVNLPHRET